jgi:hypothetical protein
VLVLFPHSHCHHVSTGTGTQCRTRCWIWGSHSDDYKQCGRPSFNTMWFGDSLTFWRNITLPPAQLTRKTNKTPKRKRRQSGSTFGGCLHYSSTCRARRGDTFLRDGLPPDRSRLRAVTTQKTTLFNMSVSCLLLDGISYESANKPTIPSSMI